MKTIRKNSKEFALVINSADWNCYSLNNCFRAESVKSVNNSISRRSTLLKDATHYTLEIHSNLWYTKLIN